MAGPGLCLDSSPIAMYMEILPGMCPFGAVGAATVLEVLYDRE